MDFEEATSVTCVRVCFYFHNAINQILQLWKMTKFQVLLNLKLALSRTEDKWVNSMENTKYQGVHNDTSGSLPRVKSLIVG